MQNAVEPRDMGVATSAVTFFRQVGGSLGTAVFLSILFSNAATNIADEPGKSAGVAGSRGRQGRHSTTPAVCRRCPDAIRHPILVGFSDAMDVVFLVGACVLVVAVVLAAMMKEVPLRTQSGLQAAREQTAAADAAAAAATAEQPSGVTPTPTGSSSR